MQIQKINQSSPNFGMAMIVEKSARPAIEKGGRNLLSKIQKAGEIVGSKKIVNGKEVDNSTKLVHLVIGEGAVPTVQTPYANRYTRYFEPQEISPLYPEFLNIKTVWAGRSSGSLKAGDQYLATIRLENSEAAQKAYKQLKEAQSDIERGAILTKVLDEKYLLENARALEGQKETQRFNSDIDSLYSEFGRKPSVSI